MRNICKVLLQSFRVTLVISVTLLLSGCFGFDGCSDCVDSASSSNVVTVAAVAEMTSLGATIVRELDDEEFVPNGDNSAITGRAALYFAPMDGLESISDGGVEQQYSFIFSQQIDNVYIEIPLKTVFETSDPSYHYYGKVATRSGPAELVITGNHILRAWKPVIEPTPNNVQGKLNIPVRATHVGLWHSEIDGTSRVLVRRVPLDSIDAWRRHFKPLIDQNCNTEC
jgi:hypothetical protein